MIVSVKTTNLQMKWLLMLVFSFAVNAKTLKESNPPIIEYKPFIVYWNIPTTMCKKRFGVDLNLQAFDIIANPDETLNGPYVTIFYEKKLGHYPYINEIGEMFNGGIPQNEKLSKHLEKSTGDIKNIIPGSKFQGLAVIDWEEWRPQWDRNWGPKNIYRIQALNHIKNLHSELSESKMQAAAKQEYESAAKSFMNSTIRLGSALRSQGHWGFYLYPECYNYDYKKKPETYTGKCPEIEITRNDGLQWLWQASTALYPSIYLPLALRNSPHTQKFVHYRVKEAMRISYKAKKDYALPVFVYTRLFYTYGLEPLTKNDLLYTIGESAAMGAAGIVIWGGMDHSNSRNSCLSMQKFVNGVFGHYIVNVTAATQRCSRILCNNNGRCVRKQSESFSYLHMPMGSIMRHKLKKGLKFFPSQRASKEHIQYMKNEFICQCYTHWNGKVCAWKDNHHSGSRQLTLCSDTNIFFSLILMLPLTLLIFFYPTIL
ncbi:hyaluronidase-1-like [Monodelphis domestica]|uniref:Hyaluronidase n=1 Tax=Monodelphis domestica TaxID=13616 RepID=F6WH69_MONDO|nr:hyaluronidase-1-like [Monodelphis domestica]XP_007504305.1 hyaluronidase-1-like [Monodelphis domestica]